MNKLSAPVKGLLFSMLATAVAFAVYFLFLQKTDAYLVDNPTPETYYFKINQGEEKIIAGGQYVEVDLHKGKNTIEVLDHQKKKLYDSAFVVKKDRALLNITHKDYFINNQYYGYNLNKDSIRAAHSIDIDGETYFTDAKKTNKLYNEDFYYNIDEKYDQVIKNIGRVEFRSKIFRKQDFLNYYKEYYNE